MGKKSRYRELYEKQQIDWYRWEFLRRNPHYRRHCESFMAEFGHFFREKGFWYDRSVIYEGKDWEFFCEVVCPRAKEICQEWQTHDPFPPDWTFDKSSGLLEYEPRFRPKAERQDPIDKVLDSLTVGVLEGTACERKYYVCLPTGCSPEVVAACWEPLQGTIEGFAEKVRREQEIARSPASPRTPTEEEKYRCVVLRFDITRPLKELLEQAQNALRFRRRFYEKQFGKKRGARPKKRRRLDQYDKYLEVWDLRKEGLSFEQIARRVYQDEYEAIDHKSSQPKPREAWEGEYNRRFGELVSQGASAWDAHEQLEREFGLDQEPPAYNPVVHRVRDHFARAKKLVEGGYKELR